MKGKKIRAVICLLVVPAVIYAVIAMSGCSGNKWNHCGIYHSDSGVGYALNMQNDPDGVYTMFSVIGEDVYSGYAKVKKDTAKVTLSQEGREENEITLEIRPSDGGRLEVKVLSAPGYSALSSGDRLIMEPGMLLLPDDKAALLETEQSEESGN